MKFSQWDIIEFSVLRSAMKFNSIVEFYDIGIYSKILLKLLQKLICVTPKKEKKKINIEKNRVAFLTFILFSVRKKEDIKILFP